MRIYVHLRSFPENVTWSQHPGITGVTPSGTAAYRSASGELMTLVRRRLERRVHLPAATRCVNRWHRAARNGRRHGCSRAAAASLTWASAQSPCARGSPQPKHPQSSPRAEIHCRSGDHAAWRIDRFQDRQSRRCRRPARPIAVCRRRQVQRHQDVRACFPPAWPFATGPMMHQTDRNPLTTLRDATGRNHATRPRPNHPGQ